MKWADSMRGAPDIATRSGADFLHLNEVRSFGSNPGNLRMFTHVPSRLPEKPALLVVLHGCTQTAASYNHGAGWSTLADRYGFALVLPEQQRTNNPNTCFTWYLPGDSERERGEALSIRQMVHKAVMENDINPRRVFITGLSAGGAMTSVMLACYPETFAGGAIIAGLPYGTAKNVQQAFESMFQTRPHSAQEWGDLVRGASPHRGPWPRLSLWHGNADKTVVPGNVGEMLKQWTNVHGLPLAPSSHALVDGYPRQVWTNDEGNELIESYSIVDMAHGTPLATGKVDGKCGAEGPFLFDVGISSSHRIAQFFGLAGEFVPVAERPGGVASSGQSADGPIEPSGFPKSEVLEGEILDKEHVEDSEPMQGRQNPSPAQMDIGAVIKNALRAAGLMKGER